MRRRDLIGLAGWGAATLAGCATLSRPDAEDITGDVARGLEPVRDAFLRSHADDPGGAQLAVYRNGRRVVDLWTGTDPVKKQPFTAESLTTVMSCTKGWTAIVAHDLAQRGVIDIDAPVTRYWPEFAAKGKGGTTVAWLLSHRAGLPSFPAASGIGWREMADWDRCVHVLEQMEPAWKPGSAVQYHAVTFGFLVGEVIRRASGRTVGMHIAEEYAKRLNLDLWIGHLPSDAEARYAPEFRLPLNAPPAPVDFLNSPAAHQSEQPAANGITNARSMAKLYAAVIGPVDGPQILRDDTIARATLDVTKGLNAPDGTPRTARYGLGFNIWNPARQEMLGPTSFGHAGAGGRQGFACPRLGMAVAYVCTNMAWDSSRGPDPRWACIDTLRRIVQA
ncbi:serine hydrolase [Phenylobacterium sp.]|uniref:serine hydrolase domain-containing protein n=1 Tax=Phenylobacterium sp. TaxID=1871053 RepID=UPI0025EBDA3A|nr:serine hydrolase domain-containing protein [Phenylobacterium sp.]MBX3485447.1 beta-lactamase family protein [Phenylobacterium sp.]MCW5760451.1 beta-lactamase family protein [Phenylobacterium sp.]